MKKLFAVALLALMNVWNVFSADVPRPEYPRPQFERTDWVNLNGTWTYEFDFGNSGKDRKLQETDKFKNNIIVPFARKVNFLASSILILLIRCGINVL